MNLVVGAGGMILAYAREVEDRGYKRYKNMFVEACDIYSLCTYMTYVQLAMYDIPAVVKNGNVLLLEEKFVLYTPQYYMFQKLLKEGKLNVEICSHCGKEINGESKESVFKPKSKICLDCHSTEQKLSVLKDLMDLK